MKIIACHTLGCKVNQYDTEAMLELFEQAGYQSVDFHQEADVYLINTCTVTGTGDNKSMKLIRRIHRQHPEAAIVVAGCLAQRDARQVMLDGVRLVVGNQLRGQVVALLEQAVAEDRLINAVDGFKKPEFEPLTVTRHEGKTRATMKIQEGCDRYCAYCIIPSVRGPVRSMPIDRVEEEARRLSEAGYKELVLTGIHLASYGRGQGVSLIDAIARVHGLPGVQRIRLGSLEPLVVDDAFVSALKGLPKVCRQFHLSMQSGSAGVLTRMRRRYTPEQYLEAAQKLKHAFPDCAITTDVLCGFPGETEAEQQETLAFVEKVGFARIHVFPYSRRAGTLADQMPDQVPQEEKNKRAAQLIELGNQLENHFVQSLVGSVQQVLFEERVDDELAEGYTGQYVRVRAKAQPGEIRMVRITSAQGVLARGEGIEGGI